MEGHFPGSSGSPSNWKPRHLGNRWAVEELTISELEDQRARLENSGTDIGPEGRALLEQILGELQRRGQSASAGTESNQDTPVTSHASTAPLLAETQEDHSRRDTATERKERSIRKRKPKPEIKPSVKLEDPKNFPTMTVPEVRMVLGISRASVYRYLDEGRLNRPGLNRKPGKRSKTLVLTNSVLRMLEETKD